MSKLSKTTGAFEMPPKGISKAVSKKCSECKKQVPVATKVCQCGHQFFEERRKSTTSNTSEQEDVVEESTSSSSLNSPTSSNKDPKEMKAGRPASVGNGSPVGAENINMNAPEGKRRSERVKREKPNFYDALEYDNQMRKARKERQKEDTPTSGRMKRERKLKNVSEQEDDDEEDELPPRKDKKKRKKKKSKNGDNKEEEIDEDIMAGITPEKEQQFNIVLADINFKLGLNNPKFIKI